MRKFFYWCIFFICIGGILHSMEQNTSLKTLSVMIANDTNNGFRFDFQSLDIKKRITSISKNIELHEISLYLHSASPMKKKYKNIAQVFKKYRMQTNPFASLSLNEIAKDEKTFLKAKLNDKKILFKEITADSMLIILLYNKPNDIALYLVP